MGPARPRTVHDAFRARARSARGLRLHHFRTPWTPACGNWRSDEHHTTASPSVALIPPASMHTTRAVGDGMHVLIDRIAPPREDSREQGWPCSTTTTTGRAVAAPVASRDGRTGERG